MEQQEEQFKRFHNRWWPIIQLYVRAINKECYIEAIILNIYITKFYLVHLIRRECLKKKQIFNLEKYLKKDINELTDIAFQKGAILKDLRNNIKDYYENYRDPAIHGLIKGEISYLDIKNAVEKFRSFQEKLQEQLIGKIKYGKEEKYEDWVKSHKK
jgi:hypothetical protein